jgi:hypothetical protein
MEWYMEYKTSILSSSMYHETIHSQAKAVFAIAIQYTTRGLWIVPGAHNNWSGKAIIMRS